MADYTNYTNKEMQAVTIAKQIKNGQVVTVGTGLPLIGASVAKRVYAPDCHIIVESGLMDCSPVEVPRSVGDLRFMAHCGCIWPNVRFVGFEINEYLHKANRLIAFIGGAQIDPYGNVNSTSIGDYHHPKTRFTGSGGANGIATYSNTIIMMQHQKRRFMEKIDYITSCGWMDGPLGLSYYQADKPLREQKDAAGHAVSLYRTGILSARRRRRPPLPLEPCTNYG